MIERPSAVLFACTMNAIRSPMAAALMRHFHGRQVWVESVGVHKGEPDPLAAVVMDEIGIDLAGHRPRSFDELEDSSFDLVISLSPEAQHHAVEMTRAMACEVEFWNTLDPSLVEGTRDQRLDVYRQVRDQLERHILRRFPLAPS
ncbi:glutaredoxin arsenate reductase [mine drainage metagenome]|uniref:Glutaredoxin arsenate reductase n=1 Tax=mine drainage metagenome TaxID=410659 RepID=A0A1J5R8N2_9ZZZZ